MVVGEESNLEGAMVLKGMQYVIAVRRPCELFSPLWVF